MASTWMLLLCALTLAVSLPQRRQGSWWPINLTLPPINVPAPDTVMTERPSTTTQAPVTTPGVPQSTPPCDCPAPPQYNPVCGSDNQTYSNPQRLECARICGQSVTVLYLGTCQLRRK